MLEAARIRDQLRRVVAERGMDLGLAPHAARRGASSSGAGTGRPGECRFIGKNLMKVKLLIKQT